MKSEPFEDSIVIEQAKAAALQVLLHNAKGPFENLPRTAAWGYPEPYTRDLMIAALGILVSNNDYLMHVLQRVLKKLALNQSRHGHIPSLAHDPEDRGASDTTPLFLLIAGLYRKVTRQTDFLDVAIEKALVWMDYQSPDDRVIVGQLPTSDWRDEHWVLGYGLYVNAIVYSYLRLYGFNKKAHVLKQTMCQHTIESEIKKQHSHEGFVIRRRFHLAVWSYKVLRDERCDLLGNSLALLAGITSATRARNFVAWVEHQCAVLRAKRQLACALPPCLFPYIQPDQPDWRPRYKKYNQPGHYHNGGVWPFICAFYTAAIVAAGKTKLAQEKLAALARLVQIRHNPKLSFGFNEWLTAQDGVARGQDWQTWSAGMFLYAARAVESNSTPFFDTIREWPHSNTQDIN